MNTSKHSTRRQLINDINRVRDMAGLPPISRGTVASMTHKQVQRMRDDLAAIRANQ